ncbi:MAG: hypothetical protein Q9197_004626, partial [Variospora fuerteventurae]
PWASQQWPTYKVATLKMAIILNLRRDFMLRDQTAGIGIARTQISLTTLMAPDAYGRLLGPRQCPRRIVGSQYFLIGEHPKSVAKNNPV